MSLMINGRPTTMAELEARRMDGGPGEAVAWKSPDRAFLTKSHPKSASQIDMEARQARQDKAIAYCADRLRNCARFPFSDLAGYMGIPGRALGKLVFVAGIKTICTYQYSKEKRGGLRTVWVIGVTVKP